MFRRFSFLSLALLFLLGLTVMPASLDRALAQDTSTENQMDDNSATMDSTEGDTWADDSVYEDQDPATDTSMTPETKSGAGAGSYDLIDGDTYKDSDSSSGSSGSQDSGQDSYDTPEDSGDSGSSEEYSEPDVE